MTEIVVSLFDGEAPLSRALEELYKRDKARRQELDALEAALNSHRESPVHSELDRVAELEAALSLPERVEKLEEGQGELAETLGCWSDGLVGRLDALEARLAPTNDRIARSGVDHNRGRIDAALDAIRRLDTRFSDHIHHIAGPDTTGGPLVQEEPEPDFRSMPIDQVREYLREAGIDPEPTIGKIRRMIADATGEPLVRDLSDTLEADPEPEEPEVLVRWSCESCSGTVMLEPDVSPSSRGWWRSSPPRDDGRQGEAWLCQSCQPKDLREEPEEPLQEISLRNSDRPGSETIWRIRASGDGTHYAVSVGRWEATLDEIRGLNSVDAAEALRARKENERLRAALGEAVDELEEWVDADISSNHNSDYPAPECGTRDKKRIAKIREEHGL